MAEEPKKICILAGPYFPVPPLRGGAVEKSIWLLAKALQKKGQTVTVLSRSDPDLPATETVDGVHIVRKPGFAQRSSRLHTAILDCLYALRWGFSLPAHDVLLVNDLFFPILAPIFLKARNMTVCLGRAPHRLLKLHSKTATFVVPTRAVALDVETISPALAKKTTVIGYPYDPAIYSCPDQSTERTVDLLFVGRLHPEKGVHTLIEAFTSLDERFQSAKLTIVGPHQEASGGGGDEYLAKLKSLASNAVTFKGPVFDQHELARIYQQARFFCYPSFAERGETFGVAVLEAMACGCIPVVSELCCFKEFVTAGENGFSFDHGARTPVTELALTLEAALALSETNEFQEKALAACTGFVPEKIADSYLELLNSKEARGT